MPIRYLKDSAQFVLTTKNTAYVFELFLGRFPIHNYYGKKQSTYPKFVPFGVSFSPDWNGYGWKHSPDVFPSEISFFGSGDFRATALRIAGKDQTGVTEFVYDSYKIFSGRRTPEGLPHARAAENTKTLAFTMVDKLTSCKLTLLYTVFYDEDVITRSIVIENKGEETVKIEKCMSLCLDLPAGDYDMVSLYGGHFREGYLQRNRLFNGNQSFGSRRGTSSHQHNPFMAICSPKATDEKGDVYGFNLVWSGSFLNEVEVDQNNVPRVMLGLGSECFSYRLAPKATFESPEAIMTYSAHGFGQMSRNFHSFTRKRIMPDYASLAPHPVVLNTWEACAFDIDEEKMLRFAEKAATYKFDMLVMDDGWFGARDHDRAGLGDWFPSPKKFPNGLAPFVKAIHDKGIQFGIWIEPEMVNPDSDLYRAHPEWAIQVPGRLPAISRNQLVLDMGNPDVVEYLKESYSKTFDGLSIDYIKWDFNRSISNFYAPSLAPQDQGEAGFRFMKGTYALLQWFMDHFPNTVVETCSGGGGRYDLGMMQYGFQIWTSDNTDPYERIRVQNGALMAYPATTMSCHVARPYKAKREHIQNHADELRSLDFRYKVSIGGMLGYEFNILETEDDYNEQITGQIAEYKSYEHLMRLGDYFRLASPDENPYYAYYYASGDRKELLLTLLQKKDCKDGVSKRLKIKEAIPTATYVDTRSGKTYLGKELRNGLSLPLEGKPDTGILVHLIAQE